MSMTEEELRVRYGTQQIESDEDDELLGDSDDDVILMSSRHDGDHAPSSDLDYQYEQELDYDEVVEMDHERYETENKTQVRTVQTNVLVFKHKMENSRLLTFLIVPRIIRMD